jgi:hypothetical protein
MTTKTDSFDRSRHGDAFVHSRVDERNRPSDIVEPRGKRVVLVQAYDSLSHTVLPDDHPIERTYAYVTGPSAPAPTFRLDSQPGISKWDSAFARWASLLGRSEYEPVCGFVHHRRFIPSLDAWFARPLWPHARASQVAHWINNQYQGYGQPRDEADQTGCFERLKATTLELVQPHEEIYLLGVLPSLVEANPQGSPHFNWVWAREMWLEWAVSTYHNIAEPHPDAPVHGIRELSRGNYIEVRIEGGNNFFILAHPWLDAAVDSLEVP